MTLSCLVVGAGTFEPYDGKFAISLANELSERGIDVTLILGKFLHDQMLSEDQNFRIVPFEYALYLNEAISREISSACPDIIFMATAESNLSLLSLDAINYTGQQPCLSERCAPSILKTLRERCALLGKRTFIVGFSLSVRLTLCRGTTQSQL